MINLKKNNSYSYIVDKNYKLVSISDELMKSKPELKLGDTCYKVLGNSNTPCRICPILNKLSSVKYSYNNKINKWSNLSCAKINYHEHGECHNVICDMIDDTINDRILNLSDYNSYDKIYEVDIVNNKYRIIVDKYGLAVDRTGKYTELIDTCLEKLIANNDKKRFKEIMTINLYDKRVSSSINFAVKEVFEIVNEGENSLKVQLISIEKDSKGRLKKFLCLFKYIKDNSHDVSHLNTDKLTGLTRGSDYYSLVDELLNNNPDIEFAMVSIDIEHFKMFNEWYGFKEGDNFLIDIASNLNEIDKSINSISGYFGDDNFCIVLPNKEQNYRLLEFKLSDYVKKHGNGVSFLPHFGVYVIKDKELNISQMYDRAVLANDTSKGNFSSRFSYYNDDMLVKLQNEQIIHQEVKKGMMNNEFTFFLQPQYNIENDKMIACEALVRWINKDNGAIPAYKFIPVLEKTGFIVEIDKFIWEEVIKWLKELILRGIKPVPVSVNVSRIDLYYLDVAAIFCGLIDKYKIEPSLVQIEITESAYIESFEKIKSTLNKLQSVGFKILMDDFGSGYSSLNMLKNVDVDILKLDMKFLQLNEDNQKGMNILESIINMIKIINIPIICEGVETNEQKELLKEMGCSYAQGYLFNRPMPKDQLEKLLLIEDKIDYSGAHAKRNDKLHIQEFSDGTLFTETSLNNILGAIAFIGLSERNIEIQRVNEQFYRLFGSQSFTDIEFKTNILKYIYKDDHEIFYQLLDDAYNNQLQSKIGEVRYLNENKILWLRVKVNYLSQNNNQKRYYISFEDISEEKENESNVYLLNQILKTTVRLGGINCFEWNVQNNELKIFTLSNKLPLYGNDFIQNNSYVLVKNFPKSIVNEKIIGKYHNLVENYIEKIISSNESNEYRFEMPFTYQGSYLWYQIKGKGVFNEYNKLVAFVGTYLDITKIVYSRLEEREKIKSLNFLNETALYSMDINLDHNTIYNIYGEFDVRNASLKKVKEYDFFIKALAMNWLHPEDKYKFIDLFSKDALIDAYNKHKSFVSMDCRTMASGEPVWLKISVYLRKIENDIIAYMFCTDIDIYYKNEGYDINTLIDNNKYGVINIKLSSYKIINANKLAAAIHNYNDINDLVSRVHNGIVDSIYVHDKNQIAEKLAQLKNPGDHQTIEYRILLSNGNFKYITCNAVVQKYDDNVFIQMLSYDNTAQKTLELNLIYEDSLKELRSLNTSYENKAFFVGINKVYESIYFCNLKLNTYIAVKNPKVLNPYIADCNTLDELMSMYVKDFVVEEDAEKVLLMGSREYLNNHLSKNNEKIFITYRRKTSEGYNWFKLDFIASTFDSSGSVENIILLVTNIHDQMKLTISYKDEMEQYKELFINSTSDIYTDMIFINLETYNAIKTIFKDNSVVEESFNRSWDKVYKDILKIVSEEYVNVIKDNLSLESLLNLEYGVKKSFRYSTKSKKNSRWFTSTVRLIEIKGVKHAVVFSMDITKDFNELLYARSNSEYDGLTMLYNRRKLASFIDNEYKKLKSCGVIFFDINGLKGINDNFGHQAGDTIIKIAADSIKAIEDEKIHGYRYGGDEFLIIVCDETRKFVDDIVDKIRNNIDAQNINSKYKCKIAVGVSYNDNIIDVDELISEADTLMYKEKNEINEIVSTNNRNKKIELLLKFLASEYDAIYEVNLEKDTYKILESSKEMILNDLPLHGTYSKLVTNYFNKYSNTTNGLNDFLINSLKEILKEKESVTYTPTTIYGNKIKIGYRCISYDENDNPVVVILTIKF